MIFQDALSALNPVFPVGWQIAEMFRKHQGMSRSNARDEAVRLMERVNIPAAKDRVKAYPHQFSGGMRQRIMIAMAIALDPAVLIADEPTTALDVTVQKQVLHLIREMQARHGTALLFVTHDLGVVSKVCQSLTVLYGGTVLEDAPVRRFFAGPRHAYSRALLAASPRYDRPEAGLNPVPDAVIAAVRAEIAAMDPKIIELENKISVEQDASARTKLESELAGLNTRFNALVQDEQVMLAKSQTLERYIEKGKTWMDSLQNQAATQMVLINKLQTDTKQRVVLYDALTSSLKTAQQQDVAHRINEIGVKTDQEAQAAMAAIGTATNNRMADMMEAHEDHMVFARKVLEAKAKADERFARRFAAIVEKHDKNQYGG